MMDVILANKLVKAIPEGAHLLLVGDVDQLPSVGAGEVLRDLLSADTIPRVRLTKIFRQARQSGIVVNAHRINAATPPQLTGFDDFFWFACELAEQSDLHPAEETAELVVDIVARRIPHKFGLNPRQDVQVLAPRPCNLASRVSGRYACLRFGGYRSAGLGAEGLRDE